MKLLHFLLPHVDEHIRYMWKDRDIKTRDNALRLSWLWTVYLIRHAEKTTPPPLQLSEGLYLSEENMAYFYIRWNLISIDVNMENYNFNIMCRHRLWIFRSVMVIRVMVISVMVIRVIETITTVTKNVLCIKLI